MRQVPMMQLNLLKIAHWLLGLELKSDVLPAARI
jgi:hypothetical protein